MSSLTASVGRIVHYRGGRECHAALVVEVHHDDDLTLQVFPPSGQVGQVRAVEGHDPGTWHWPERVE